MEKRCNTCGYRMNPHTAQEAGLITNPDPTLDNFCYMANSLVRPQFNCPDWISWEEVDYEKKFFQNR